MTPTPHVVPWTALQAVRTKGTIKLAHGRRGVMVRRVLGGGLMLALADDQFFDLPTPAAIPHEDERPLGIFVVEFDARGFWTDRILKLQDRPAPALTRGEQT